MRKTLALLVLLIISKIGYSQGSALPAGVEAPDYSPKLPTESRLLCPETPTVVTLEAEDFAHREGARVFTSSETSGGHFVELRSGEGIETEIQVPSDGTYTVYARVFFGSTRGLVVTLGERTFTLERKGQQLFPTNKWIDFMGPFGGENFVPLKAGTQTLKISTIASESRRPEELQGSEQRRGAFVDTIWLSTFLTDVHAQTRKTSALIVAEAKAEDMARQLARAEIYSGQEQQGSASVAGDIVKTQASFFELDRALEAAFRANEDIMHGERAKNLKPEIDQVDGILKQTETTVQSLSASAEKGLNSLAEKSSMSKFEMPAVATKKRKSALNEIYFTVDDVESNRAWSAESPKWDSFEALNFDGITPLRIGRYPGAVNPTEGEYDFGAVDEAVAVHADPRHGYKTLLLVDPYPPTWLVAKLGAEEAQGYSPTEQRAGWGWANVFSDAVKQWAYEYFTRIGEHFRFDENIIGYAFYNEPGAAHGYGKACEEEFREYLRKKYGTVERLNEKWGTSFADLDNVKVPDQLKVSRDNLKDTGWIYDYQQFRMQSYANFFQLCITALQKADPNHFVMSRLRADSFSIPLDGNDYYRLASLDWDMYSVHDDLNRFSALVTGNYVYSLNRYFHHRLGNDECHWVVWESRQSTDEFMLRNCVQREMWRELVWGKSVINNERGLTSAWNDWNDQVPEFRFDNETIRYCTGAIPVVRDKADKLKHMIFDAEIKSDGVGVIEPLTSLTVSYPDLALTDGRPGARLPIPFLEAREIMKWLFANHYQHFVVPEEAILSGKDNLAEYNVLVLPYATHMPDAMVFPLMRWVEKGGTLIAVGPPGIFDEYGRERKDFLRALLPITGVELLPDPSPQAASAIYDTGGNRAINNSPWNWRLNLAETGQKPTVLCKNDQGDPVALKVGHGKGQVVVTTLSISANPWMYSLLEDALEQAVPVKLADCDDPDVSLTVREDNRGIKYLAAINHDPKEAARMVVRLGGDFASIVDIFVGEGFPVSMKKLMDGEGVEFALDLNPGEGTVFALK